MSASVELNGITKRFGELAAVDDLSLTVRAGEFLTLLGPSGCGKTTLLRVIAGFERPDRGTVTIGGRNVTELPPYRRPVNQVFQSYALFPHLTVAENIAFGLKMERHPAGVIAERVAAAVSLVSLQGLESRKPQQLSGGQRQRVALARALAPQPAVLLLDEPLSALDAKLRHAMQLELKRLQRQVGTTFIFVTHDQEEALTMSDRIALVNRGRIEQLSDVHEIYHRPTTTFAAEFIGQANLVPIQGSSVQGSDVLVRLEGGLELRLPAAAWPTTSAGAVLSIRPEKIHVSKVALTGENTFPARVVEEIFRGATDRLLLETKTGCGLTALVANESALREPIHVGDDVWCAIHDADIVVLPSNEPK